MDQHENVDDIMITDNNDYDDVDENNELKKERTRENWTHQELMQFSSHFLEWILRNKEKNGYLTQNFMILMRPIMMVK
jgi:hypothetical protein